ncbi:MAG: diadenylate cyclase CdaA [Anaerolineae bacterium]|nr:diadenylate cyclase CdaA [Anaerolineae bacterium]MCX8066789.1 diadenylate cyclase CdaA [Anaerolineae bacterium]MDW7990927.1 diadenylate cyclase CdaA [Anaerolineae bacterium]
MLDFLWTLQRIGWMDVVDILLVATIFFVILYLVRGTRAMTLLRGIILLIILLAILSTAFRLRAFGWLVDRALPALLVAVPVIFQPELRRALERLGRAGSLLGRPPAHQALIERTLRAITETCRVLSRRRHGALIVLERETGLQEYVETGVTLDAEISPELLIAIFDPHIALHDGAVIVRDGRVVAAACVLPLSTAFLEDRRLGLRHRAALGITEETDAIAVVVSEERGTISVAHNGRIIRDLDPDRLERVLHTFYQTQLEVRRLLLPQKRRKTTRK